MLGKQLKVESAIARFIDLRLNAKKTQAGGRRQVTATALTPPRLLFQPGRPQ